MFGPFGVDCSVYVGRKDVSDGSEARFEDSGILCHL